MFYRDERMALFIDGHSLHAASRSLGFDIDYKLLRQEFMTRGKLVRIYFYKALYEGDAYSAARPLVDWLEYNGFTLVTKPVKEFTDSLGRRRTKANMDVELAIDALAIADHVDHVVLFSGEGNLCALVAAIQRRGARVTVVSTIASEFPVIADELRRQADNFIELHEMRDLIARPPRDPVPEGQADRAADELPCGTLS